MLKKEYDRIKKQKKLEFQALVAREFQDLPYIPSAETVKTSSGIFLYSSVLVTALILLMMII